MTAAVCPPVGRWDGATLEPAAVPWSQAAELDLRENLTAAAPAQPTSVRCGRNAAALLCLFLCVDLHPWATRTGHDEPLWEEEVVELFLDPFGDGALYYELEVNVLNATFDAVARRSRSGYRKDFSWTCAGLRTAAARTAEGWRAAMEVPFVALGDAHPERCPVWRVNFTRIDRPPGRVRELSAWAPTGLQTFHAPERWGLLRVG